MKIPKPAAALVCGGAYLLGGAVVVLATCWGVVRGIKGTDPLTKAGLASWSRGGSDAQGPWTEANDGPVV